MIHNAALVDIHNMTRQKGLDATIKRAISETARVLKIKKGIEVSVVLVGNKEMADMYSKWKGERKVTDVLSFSFLEGLTNKFPAVAPDNIKRMGEIIICVPFARKQSKQLNISFKKNIATLASHGMIHLFGIDHEKSASEYQRTIAIQNRVVKTCNL